jgi:hypothetical protein
MPLKLTIAKLVDVAEPLRASYRQRSDGEGFILDVEGGVVAKSVHDEFRNKNVELLKKLKDLGDLTPEITELKEKAEKLEQDLEKARKNKDADAEARIKAVQDGLQKKLDEAAKTADTYKARLETVLIDGEVAKVAAEIGAHPTAIDDIAVRVRPRFKVGEDNKPYAIDATGNKVYGEDGQPLGIAGAVRQLTKAAPHLFKPSSGGGASNSSAGGGRNTTGSNPWKKESWNVTEQMKALKADKSEASRLAAEAGVQV